MFLTWIVSTVPTPPVPPLSGQRHGLHLPELHLVVLPHHGLYLGRAAVIPLIFVVFAQFPVLAILLARGVAGPVLELHPVHHRAGEHVLQDRAPEPAAARRAPLRAEIAGARQPLGAPHPRHLESSCVNLSSSIEREPNYL